MWLVTIIYGDLLMLLGLGFYFGTGQSSVTALIPLFFGLPVAGLGAVAKNEKMKKHAMHAASVFGLIGILATAKGVLNVMRMVSGTPIERPAAAIEMAIMCVLSVLFLGLCIKSFIDARIRRKNAETSITA